jgi:branched-chain amino acid transport system ATP-binding protein
MSARMSPVAATRHDTAFVEAADVHAHYGQSHILHGVSLTIAPGEAVGLLGRNGMGKTTLIRTMLGLHRASSGTVRIAGRDVTHDRPDRIARLGIGYVPEGRGIFPNLSVRENLMMAARRPSRFDVVDSSSAGEGDARALPPRSHPDGWTLPRVLATFPRLAERLDHGGAALSGGEQQMLAIGRALMLNPDIVILDEATEGLAPLIVAEIWRIIGVIRASGIASLVVDRNYRAVLAHTDRCVVLQKGRIVLEGASSELRDSGTLAVLLGV